MKAEQLILRGDVLPLDFVEARDRLLCLICVFGYVVYMGSHGLDGLAVMCLRSAAHEGPEKPVEK